VEVWRVVGVENVGKKDASRKVDRLGKNWTKMMDVQKICNSVSISFLSELCCCDSCFFFLKLDKRLLFGFGFNLWKWWMRRERCKNYLETVTVNFLNISEIGDAFRIVA
jgi:hypothetical protein